MSIATITPGNAKRLLAEGSAILVDIREPAEHAREAIPGARPAPLSGFDPQSVAALRGNVPAVIFHCQSGRRTVENSSVLRACGDKVYLLEGGLAGWKAAGLETRIDRTKPIEMQRQVQIAAGLLVLSGVVLSLTVSPLFIGLSAFVGCGLVFAGVSGWCGMAKLLGAMPWNRISA